MSFNKAHRHSDHESKIQSILSQVHQRDVQPKGNPNKRGSVFDLGGPKEQKQGNQSGQGAMQDARGSTEQEGQENYQGGPNMTYNQNTGQYNPSSGGDMESYQTSAQSYKLSSQDEVQYNQQPQDLQTAEYQDNSYSMQMNQQGWMQFNDQQYQQQGFYQGEHYYGDPSMPHMYQQSEGTFEEQQSGQYTEQGYQSGQIPHDEQHQHSGYHWRAENFPDNPNSSETFQQSDTLGEQNMELDEEVQGTEPQPVQMASQTKESVKKPKPATSTNVMATQDTVNDRTYCEVCDVKFQKESQYWIHCRGLAHYQKVEELERGAKEEAKPVSPEKKEQGVPSWVYCEPCDMNFYSEGSYMVHLKTDKHLAMKELFERERKKQQVVDIKERAVKKEEWVPAQEKNLTPVDIGKESSNPFFCEVCNISCTGGKNFEMHLAGSKHLKKVKRAELLSGLKETQELNRGPMIQKKEKAQSSIQPAFDSCREPLIGADYVTEYQKQDLTIEPRFACTLCQCKMSPEQVILHLTGTKHRIKYMKYHYPSNYNILWPMKKSEKSSVSEKMAAQVEKKEGRYNIRLRIEVDPFSKDKNGTWEDVPRERVRSGLPGDKTEKDLQGFVEERPGQQNDEEGEVTKKYGGPVPTLLAVEAKPSRSFDDMDWSVGAYTEADRAAVAKKGKYYSQWMRYFKELDREKEYLEKQEKAVYRRGASGARGRGRGRSFGRGDTTSFSYERGRDTSYESPYDSLFEGGLDRHRPGDNVADLRRDPPPDKMDAERQFENLLDQIKKKRAETQIGDPSKKVERLGDRAQQATAMLQTMGDSLVADESDAEVALQMSNTLTQALLNYRMKSLPEDERSEEMKNKLQMLSEVAKELTLPGSAFSQKPPPPPHKLVQEDVQPLQQPAPESNQEAFGMHDTYRTPGYSKTGRQQTKGKHRKPEYKSAQSSSAEIFEQGGHSRKHTGQPSIKTKSPGGKVDMSSRVYLEMKAKQDIKTSSEETVKETLKKNSPKESFTEKVKPNLAYPSARETAKNIVVATMAARREIRKQEIADESSSPLASKSPSTSKPSKDRLPSNFKAYMSQLKMKSSSGGSDNKPKYTVTWPSGKKVDTQRASEASGLTGASHVLKRSIADPLASDSPQMKKTCTGSSPIF